ncbi:MAG TPA: dihydropteroate synthase, partial [Candidatus Gracilibacteria bacterium]|nr:dihydropteroate synthase [Candidatus Gracilibacteria bacterium]
MGAFVSSEPFYSLQLLKRLKELESLDCPILVGASRKSFIGKTLDVPLHERLEGGLAAAAIAVWNGAAIIRAHDVKETRRVVDMVHAIQST